MLLWWDPLHFPEPRRKRKLKQARKRLAYDSNSRAVQLGRSGEALHLSGQKGMSWKYSCLKRPGMQWKTWERFCNSMFLLLWHHSVCMVVCAGGSEVFKARIPLLTSHH